jgi:hypothetical protein
MIQNRRRIGAVEHLEVEISVPGPESPSKKVRCEAGASHAQKEGVSVPLLQDVSHCVLDLTGDAFHVDRTAQPPETV